MENTQHHKVLFRSTAYKAIRRGYVDTPEGQIHYWTAGSGPALLLVHQSSSSGEEYAGLVPYLADHYQLIAYDWLGHGNSDDPDFPPGVEVYGKGGEAVLLHLGIDKFSILGHHGGALVSMNLAYKYPQRVEKVILSGTSGLKPPEETKKFLANLEEKKTQALKRDGQALFSAWGRFVDYLPEASPKEVLRPFMNYIMSQIRPYDAHYGVLSWDRRPALEGLECPVLLIQGLQDSYVSHQENLLEIIPNAQRKVIKNGGAFLFFDKVKECSEMIREFLG
ncbi:MAG: alpha/beta hydrolase [Bacteroidota bacterium]